MQFPISMTLREMSKIDGKGASGDESAIVNGCELSVACMPVYKY
jgi:hypothetical protein